MRGGRSTGLVAFLLAWSVLQATSTSFAADLPPRGSAAQATPEGRLLRKACDVGSRTYRWLTANPTWQAHARSLGAALATVPGHGTILDVGVGPGVSTIHMALANTQDRFIGLDFSRGMLALARVEVARHDLAARVGLLGGDAAHLPLRSGSLKGVTTHSLLYLTRDRGGVLREMHRTLRPQGMLILTEPRAGLQLGFLKQALRDPRHALAMLASRAASSTFGGFRGRDLEALVRQAGFVDVEANPVLDGMMLELRARRPE